jgi:ribonuclease D
MIPSCQPAVLEGGDLNPSMFRVFSSCSAIAWDIETTGLNWDHDRIATCQLFNPTVGTFVVQVGPSTPSHLFRLLEDANVMKVFHHAMFDLRFMAFHWGAKPANIACTKVSSKLLNPTESDHSLKTLLRRHLGVQIDKKEQLSDWTSRQLSASQLEYAANDVLYLIDLFDKLRDQLYARGLLDLLVGCFLHIPTRVQLDIRRYPDVFTY